MSEAKIRRVNWGRFCWLFIAAVTILAYSNSFSGAWIFDDIHTIEKIAQTTGSGPGGVARISERPVTDLSFALNWKMGGGKAADFHAVNLLLHLTVALLLFGLVRRLLGRSAMAGWGGYGLPATLTAAVGASLWAVHPLTTAAVTYLSQRYEVLMSLFYLLTLYAFVRGHESRSMLRSVAWYVAAIVACLLGTGSKEVMLTAPLAVLLCDWIFLAKGKAGVMLVKRGWVYLGLSLSWVALFALMHMKGGEEGYYAYAGMPAYEYAAIECGVICRYLRLAFWPFGLCFDYGWNEPVSLARIVVPGMAVGAMLAVTLMGLVRRRQWAFPVALFFLILAPTSTFIARPDPIMEHRMYLPLAGLVVYVVTGLVYVGRVTAARAKIDGKRLRWAGLALFCLVLPALLTLTRLRNAEYESDVRLWETTVRQRPANVRARLGLGSALFRQKETRRARTCFEGVLTQIKAGVAGRHAYIRTVEAQAHNNLGAVLFREGDMAGAAREFSAALDIFPDYVQAKDNLERVAGGSHAMPPVEEAPGK